MHLGLYWETATRRNPETLALVDHQVRWSYRHMGRVVELVAAFLWERGLRPGDRVLTLAAHRREVVTLFWAAMRLGLVFVPVSPELAVDDALYCVEDAEPDLVFFDRRGQPVVEMLERRGGLPRQVYPIEDLDRVLGHYRSRGSAPALAIDPNAVALLLYSSGITGQPKGVPRSHLNEISATLAHVIQTRSQPGEKALAVSPLYHTMGIRVIQATAFLSGTLVFPMASEPAAWAEAIRREGVTSLYAFPTFYQELLRQGRDVHLQSVRRVAYAGATMPPGLTANVFEAVRPDVFVNHFGSTEIYTYTVCSWLDRKPGCAGRPGLHAEVRLITPDPDREAGVADTVARGERGELIVRMTSPEAFRGYWNRAELTGRVVRDGWYFTGDVAVMDDEGDYWVVDRLDDVVVVGERKLYPSDVETVLRRHPGVQDALARGWVDPAGILRVVAYVVPASAAVTPGDLLAYCRTSPELADVRQPHEIRLVGTLPRQAGKPTRRPLALPGKDNAGRS